MQTGGAVDREESIAAIQAMLDDGVNFVDTAPVYNAGHSEQVVGEALQGRRDKLFLATKQPFTTTPSPGRPSRTDGGTPSCACVRNH